VSFDCRRFRDRLEAAIREPHASSELVELGWQEHLLECGECRKLLDAEEALEILLDSLPSPHLPPELARRVLVGLERAKERAASAADDLDRLLELDREAKSPAGLSSRLLAGLANERSEAALDRLLDLAPVPEIPVGLAARTLAALEDEHAPVASRSRLWLRIAAAALVAGAGWWTWTRLAAHSAPSRVAPIANDALPTDRGAAQPSPELLASMPVLEAWDFLQGDDLDRLLSDVDARDELLLELADDPTSDDGAPATTTKNG
jgi:hypothetical protein